MASPFGVVSTLGLGFGSGSLSTSIIAESPSEILSIGCLARPSGMVTKPGSLSLKTKGAHKALYKPPSLPQSDNNYLPTMA